MKQKIELPGLSEDIKKKNGASGRALRDKIQALREVCTRHKEVDEKPSNNADANADTTKSADD